jgi:hypothetical protein
MPGHIVGGNKAMSLDTGTDTQVPPQQAELAAKFGQVIGDIDRAQASLAEYRNRLLAADLTQVTARPVEVDDFAARTRMVLRQVGLHGEALRTILPDAD